MRKNHEDNRFYGNKRTASQLAIYKEQAKRQSKHEAQEKKKSNAKTIEQIPDNLNDKNFMRMKTNLQKVVDEANDRIDQIRAAGFKSLALDRVERESGDYFNITDIQTREDLVRESVRLRVFLNDKGSTVEGAKLESIQIDANEYLGKFGNNYNTEEHKFARYDTKSIDKEKAERAFKSYRKIEENMASLIKQLYGSENLIIALYDAEIKGKDSYLFGQDLMDTLYESSQKGWDEIVKGKNDVVGITGIIEDKITGRYKF